MQEKLTSNRTALALRQAGFDEYCFVYVETPNTNVLILNGGKPFKPSSMTRTTYYMNLEIYRIALPTLSQAAAWLETERGTTVREPKGDAEIAEAAESLGLPPVTVTAYLHKDGKITCTSEDNPDIALLTDVDDRPVLMLATITGRSWTDCMRKIGELQGAKPYDTEAVLETERDRRWSDRSWSTLNRMAPTGNTAAFQVGKRRPPVPGERAYIRSINKHEKT